MNAKLVEISVTCWLTGGHGKYTQPVVEHWRGTATYRAYEVSDQFRVRSRNRVVKGKSGSSRFIKGRILIPVVRHGHPCVNLWRGNRCVRVRVDQLVAEAFGIPMRDDSLRRKLRR